MAGERGIGVGGWRGRGRGKLWRIDERGKKEIGKGGAAGTVLQLVVKEK